MLHVNAFLEGDTKDERSAFTWRLTSTLAKCKQECANAVYDKTPNTATEVIEAINVWGQQHGFTLAKTATEVIEAINVWGQQHGFTLAKTATEVIEAINVWGQQHGFTLAKTATEVIEAINVWGQQHGFTLVGEYGRRSRFSHLLRKETFLAVMVGMVEVY